MPGRAWTGSRALSTDSVSGRQLATKRFRLKGAPAQPATTPSSSPSLTWRKTCERRLWKVVRLCWVSVVSRCKEVHFS